MSLKTFVVENRRSIGAVIGIVGFFAMFSIPSMMIIGGMKPGDKYYYEGIILTFIAVGMWMSAFFIDDTPTYGM